MEFLYELKPQFDRAKSFYNKANVYKDEEGNLVLRSYTTFVAKIYVNNLNDESKIHLMIKGWYSNTTSRHIAEFLRQHGFRALSKKDIERGYII